MGRSGGAWVCGVCMGAGLCFKLKPAVSGMRNWVRGTSHRVVEGSQN